MQKSSPQPSMKSCTSKNIAGGICAKILDHTNRNQRYFQSITNPVHRIQYMIWLLSGVGYVPTPNVHSDTWDHVESYAICMLLAWSLKITFTSRLELIISFLVSTYYSLLPSLDSHSSLVRVGTLLFLFLLCCISRLGPRGLQQT